MIRFLVALVVTSLLLAACSMGKVPPTRSAGYYFKEGERLFEKELYEDAIASFEKVRDSYYSPELNILAELKIAEAYYRSEQYVEAADSQAGEGVPGDGRAARYRGPEARGAFRRHEEESWPGEGHLYKPGYNTIRRAHYGRRSDNGRRGQ